MNIVVFCPSLIGDTVMATPVFRALRKAYPRSRLTAVMRPNVAPVLAGTDWFDETVFFHPHGKDRAHHATAVVKRLRTDRRDAAVLLPNSFRSAWVAWLSGIERRVGYNRYARGLLLTDRLQPPRDEAGKLLPCPIVEYYLALLRPIGCPTDGVRLELATTAGDEAAADAACRSLGVPPDRPIVCLNNGGAFGPAKSWPNPYYGTLARRLADELDVSVVVLCGPAEREASREIAERADHPRVATLADQPLSLGLSKAFVRRAALLVTTDSGPRHFAAAFGTPVVTLFGPTRIEWTRTNHPHAVHVYHPVPCGPCQRPVCPLKHHDCMNLLAPDRVFEAARRMLGRYRDGAPCSSPSFQIASGVVPWRRG